MLQDVTSQNHFRSQTLMSENALHGVLKCYKGQPGCYKNVIRCYKNIKTMGRNLNLNAD